MRSLKRIRPFLDYLEREWKKRGGDERFGQFICNLGLVDHTPGTWNAEMSDYPIPHEDMREIQTWGTVNNDRNEYEEKYIKDLDTDHIEAILKTQHHIKKTSLETVLKNELKFRKKLKQPRSKVNSKK